MNVEGINFRNCFKLPSGAISETLKRSYGNTKFGTVKKS